MPKIGIFWIYRGTVLGRARPIEEGESREGFIDTPDGHVDFWETMAKPCPELMDRDYIEIPRGRVLYHEKRKRSVVYLDRVLNQPKSRTLVVKFFGLNPGRVDWKLDQHYTTDPDELDEILADD